ncbi:LptA/OstA family protein [Helicobacter sp. MIT 99-5507]|uniref:LptA/OstA family protein n=1 Tax=Helicobacter sp. MIT 99-5507 TaxID=152489 RepID=UPI000E1E67DB|nr:LptA/OstA family protein [Helicobacter sp. MIT 99-5507]RDU57878.1 lipopolysaccharide transport periplasmic protein LptA [Helicobacter sp. MIT 99-5507]
MIFRIIFIFISVFLYADDTLEVKALHFKADELKGIIELNENVEIKRGKDELYASKVIINIDKDRMPTNYSAYGGVDFVVVTKDNRILKGKANEVYYNAINGEYKLVGDSKVIEDGTTNAVTGEEIIINNDIGYVNITGTSKKPAKIIFKLEEGKTK